MKLQSLIHESWVSVSASRLRTFLAMLGIVIGVGSVVLMVAVGSGSQRAVEASINKLGTNLLIIVPGVRENKGLRTSDVSRFSIHDAELLASLPSVMDAAASTERKPFQISSGATNLGSFVVGTTESGITIRNWELAAGDLFTSEDQRLGKRVVVIGDIVANELFEGQDPIGAAIRINGITFRVIGVLKPKGQSLEGRDQDNVIFMPITTAQAKLWGFSYWQGIVNNLAAKARSKELLDKATREIEATLRTRFKLKEAEANNFTVHNIAAITKVATDTTRALSLLLGAIASISLVVGGIGIMNIMLVTVSERTREIGIRKAIGANERMILTQFLLEALMIAGVGSILGLAIGFGLGYAAESKFSIPVYYSMWSVLTALLVAATVGIASGIYPAYKAAKLQPIEALRVA